MRRHCRCIPSACTPGARSPAAHLVPKHEEGKRAVGHRQQQPHWRRRQHLLHHARRRREQRQARAQAHQQRRRQQGLPLDRHRRGTPPVGEVVLVQPAAHREDAGHDLRGAPQAGGRCGGGRGGAAAGPRGAVRGCTRACSRARRHRAPRAPSRWAHLDERVERPEVGRPQHRKGGDHGDAQHSHAADLRGHGRGGREECECSLRRSREWVAPLTRPLEPPPTRPAGARRTLRAAPGRSRQRPSRWAKNAGA
jgi:hypothetical protein